MTRQIRHIYGNSRTTPDKDARRNFEDDPELNSEDSALFRMISEYMKGRIDLEEVKNDPALPGIEGIVSDMIEDYNKNKIPNVDNEKFIRDALNEEASDKKIMDEICQIKHEISNSNINEISAEWVKNWHEKGQRKGNKDWGKKKNRDFITSSLEPDKRNPEIKITTEREKGLKRSFFRYFSLSAAAIIFAIVFINILSPLYNPEKLFNSYYEPLNAVLPGTRSLDIDQPDNYSSAIEKYKLGDYQSAAIEFSNALLKDNSAIIPRFYLGITQLELGNYDQAINLLSEVLGSLGEYGKDAEWYLGLAYLKTGEKGKASACFEILAQTSGFYQKRADKILRRLK
ncbi:MAG: hypothetical protein MUC93_13350 [Bacteroidales bacterium]|jgi:TolA-binding protein|nr:hypothetical protein [Bacteroidales bacterium]